MFLYTENVFSVCPSTQLKTEPIANRIINQIVYYLIRCCCFFFKFTTAEQKMIE